MTVDHALSGFVSRAATRGWHSSASTAGPAFTTHGQRSSLGDPRSESALESFARAVFVERGLPAPILQAEFWNGYRWLTDRVDFWWPEFRTVGEADGLAKFERRRPPSAGGCCGGRSTRPTTGRSEVSSSSTSAGRTSYAAPTSSSAASAPRSTADRAVPNPHPPGAPRPNPPAPPPSTRPVPRRRAARPACCVRRAPRPACCARRLRTAGAAADPPDPPPSSHRVPRLCAPRPHLSRPAIRIRCPRSRTCVRRPARPA